MTTVSRRFATPSSRRFHFPLMILCGGLVVVCLILGVFSLYRFFRVTRIICTEEDHECSVAIIDELDMYKGRSIYSVTTPTIFGKKVTVEKKYPQTLIVHVEPQTVLLTVFTDLSGQSQAIIYTDATVEKRQSPLSSPSAKLRMTDLTLSAVQSTSVLSQDKLSVYTELQAFSKEVEVEEIIIRTDDEIEIKTDQPLSALLSFRDLHNQLHSLQLLLASPTIEQKPARVDMRFNRPVLQYY